MDLRLWLEERFRPICILAATPEADAACAKSGLDTLHLFKPFSCATQDIYRGIREGDSIAMKNFGVRFIRPDSVREMDPKTRVVHFKKMLVKYQDYCMQKATELDEALDTVASLDDVNYPDVLQATGSVLIRNTYPPWHEIFIRDYVSMIRCSYFDTVDHPVAAIHVLLATIPSTLDSQFQSIQNASVPCRNQLPGMDPQIMNFYLLLHDNSAPNVTHLDAAQQLRQLIQLAGKTTSICASIPINSNKDTSSNVVNAKLWLQVANELECYATDGSGKVYDMPGTGALSGAPVGRLMSAEDCKQITFFVQTFFVQNLVPFLEKRYRELVVNVNERRVTTFGKVAAWFRSSNAPTQSKGPAFVPSPTGTGDAHYLADSLEMCMRKCGDLALFLQNYDSAQNYYRMAREEWTQSFSEQQRSFNLSYMAACQEGIGICYFFMGKLPLPCTEKLENRLETARDAFLKGRVFSYAFRVSLILIAQCRFRPAPQNEKALYLLFQALTGVKGNQMYFAILNEMCAMCYLVCNPHHPGSSPVGSQMPENYPLRCSIRKFAHHIKAAGERYVDVNIDHSLRCLRHALQVMRPLGANTYPKVSEVLHVTIAEQFLRKKEVAKAIGHLIVASVKLGTPKFVEQSKYNNPVDQVERFLFLCRSFMENGGVEIHPSSLTATTTEHHSPRSSSPNNNQCQDVLPYMPIPDVGGDIQIKSDIYSQDEMTERTCMLLGLKLDKEFGSMEDMVRRFLLKSKKGSPHALPRSKQEDARMKPTSALLKQHQKNEIVQLNVPVNEAVRITIPLVNRLSTGVTIERIALLYIDEELAPKGEDGEALNYTVMTSLQDGTVYIPPFSVVTYQLNWQAPKKMGKFLIIGMQWTFSEITGRFYFGMLEKGTPWEKQPEKLFPIAVRAPLRTWVESHKCIRVIAGNSISKLAISLNPPLPLKMRDGQVHKAELQLKNWSSVDTVYNATLQLSVSNLHLIALDGYHVNVSSCGVATPTSPCSPLFENADDDSLIDLTSLQILPNGQHVIPCVFRAQYERDVTQQGAMCYNHVVMMVAYSTIPLEKNPSTKMQCHRFARRIIVTPSLKITSLVLPPTSEGVGHVICLNVANQSARTEAPCRICRVTACGKGWKLHLLFKEAMLADNAIGCWLSYGQMVSLPIEARRCGMGKHMELQDFHCLQDFEALPKVKSELLRQIFGEDLCENETSQRFAKLAPLGGAGTIGQEMLAGTENFVFYADKGGEGNEVETMPAKMHGQVALHQSAENARLEVTSFSPVLISVIWSSEEDGQTNFGQNFHFVDARGVKKLTQCCPPPQIGPTASPTNEQDRKAKLEQEELLEAFQQDATLDPKRGLVALCAQFPHAVKTALGNGKFHVIPITVLVTNFSICACNVDIAVKSVVGSGLSPSHPFSYCGRTKAKVLNLLPDETRAVEFKAQIAAPGVYDINALEVRATTSVRTMAVDRISVVGLDTPWLCAVHYDSAQGLSTSQGPSPSRPQGRMRTLSLVGPQGMLIRQSTSAALQAHKDPIVTPVMPPANFSESSSSSEADSTTENSPVEVPPESTGSPMTDVPKTESNLTNVQSAGNMESDSSPSVPPPWNDAPHSANVSQPAKVQEEDTPTATPDKVQDPSPTSQTEETSTTDSSPCQDEREKQKEDQGEEKKPEEQQTTQGNIALSEEVQDNAQADEKANTARRRNPFMVDSDTSSEESSSEEKKGEEKRSAHSIPQKAVKKKHSSGKSSSSDSEGESVQHPLS